MRSYAQIAYPHCTVDALLFERIMEGASNSRLPQRLRVSCKALARPEGLTILRQVHCAIWKPESCG